jgi:hypothetical protein
MRVLDATQLRADNVLFPTADKVFTGPMQGDHGPAGSLSWPGYVSGSLYHSQHGCGPAFKADASAWGSGSGSIHVALYRDGVLVWADHRNFSGSYGSYPLTHLTHCGPGVYRLAAWVHHTNGYNWHEMYRTIVC